MIKIGAGGSPTEKRAAQFAQKELENAGIESQILDFAAAKNLEEIFAGGAMVVVAPLKNLPTALPEGIKITAVSQRGDAADWLIVRRQSVDFQKFLKIPAGGRVAVFSEIQKMQFADFRGDVQTNVVEVLNLDDVLDALRHGDFDAAILPAADLNWHSNVVEVLNLNDVAANLMDFEITELNPQEFVPAVGQGVLAWLALADDLPTRRLLKKIHHPEVAACTNVERKILKTVGDKAKLAVFCQRDSMGNFHVFAARKTGDSLRRARVSQTTSVGLAEQVLFQILN